MITSPTETGSAASEDLTTVTAGAGSKGVVIVLVSVGAGSPGGGVAVTEAVLVKPRRSATVVVYAAVHTTVASTGNVAMTLSPSQSINAVPIRGSVTVTLVSGTSPSFVTLNENVIVPGNGTDNESEDLTRFSEASARGSDAVDVLFDGLVSVTPDGRATVAVLDKAGGGALTGAVPVTV